MNETARTRTGQLPASVPDTAPLLTAQTLPSLVPPLQIQ